MRIEDFNINYQTKEQDGTLKLREGVRTVLTVHIDTKLALSKLEALAMFRREIDIILHNEENYQRIIHLNQ